MNEERPLSEHADQAIADIRRQMWHAVRIGVFGFLVVVVGIEIMAWQHQGTVLIGMTFSLMILAGSLCMLAYRLGMRQRR